MRVLLAGELSDALTYLPELSDELRKAGVAVDILDLKASQWIVSQTPFRAPPSAVVRALAGIPRLGRLARNGHYRRLLRHLPRYDVINIHYASGAYADLAGALKAKTRAIVVSIWGSDLLRATDAGLRRLRRLFARSDMVTFNNTATEQAFAAHYGAGTFPTTILRFGLRSLDVIDGLRFGGDRRAWKLESGLDPSKTVIACGYNARRSQQHRQIVEELARLPQSQRDRVQLLFPLTYPRDAEYLREIREAGRRSGMECRYVERQLSLEEVCLLRLATDITVNVQESDSFSATIQESCYAGSIMVTGDWLPYDTLEEAGYRLRKVHSTGDITVAVRAALDFPQHGGRDSGANQRLYALSSWRDCIHRWIDLYTRVLQNTTGGSTL